MSGGMPPFPGDLAVEEKLASLMRWNALAMVAKANQAYGERGGHIASRPASLPDAGLLAVPTGSMSGWASGTARAVGERWRER